VGAVLAEENLKPPTKKDCAPPAQEVIVQVDGGHIPIKDKDKRSFEALSAIVYRPENNPHCGFRMCGVLSMKLYKNVNARILMRLG
jgi:hypothetical protein